MNADRTRVLSWWFVWSSVIAIMILAIVISVDRKKVSVINPVVVTGLNTPRGLTQMDDGSLLIAEVRGGRLLRLSPHGDLNIIQDGLPATLGGPGGQYPTGVSAAVVVEDVFYFVVGEHRGRPFSTLYSLVLGEDPQFFAGGVQLGGMPATHLTNPYDLVQAPEGGFFVSDSGYNAVLHVTASGNVLDYALFPERTNPLYPEHNIHPTIDVVPTGITYGPDGALYVASFTGFPNPPGAAAVYRVEDLNFDGDAADEGEVTVFAEGLSVATDLVFEDKGTLLVTEFSENMASFGGVYDLERSTAAPGRLVRLVDGEIETVADGLISPTALTVIGSRIFVSEEFAGRVTEVCISEAVACTRHEIPLRSRTDKYAPVH